MTFIVQNPLKLETVQTPGGFLRAAFQPSEYFQHFILKNGTLNRSKISLIIFEI